MSLKSRTAATLACLAVMLCSTSALSAPVGFTATYNGGGGTQNISGKEPSTTGKYPVFIYLVGTTESHTSTHANQAVDGMANRGYVSATVQYPNSSFGYCSTMLSRTRAIFDAANTNSAVSRLCARAKADCSKGVVVSGFSQGSVLATLSKNYDSRVRAVYGQGIGVEYSYYDLSSCMANGNHALPGDRLRALTGENDGFMGGSRTSVRVQQERLTGMDCGFGATSCERANGSGWQMVMDSDVSDLNADHCYMRVSGCTGSIDSRWSTGSGASAMNYNLDWLSGFTDP